MYELLLQVKILGKAPLIFTWWNSEKMKLEGCLITCPCQQLHLEDKEAAPNEPSENGNTAPQNSPSWVSKLSSSILKAEIISICEGLTIKSVMKNGATEDRSEWVKLGTPLRDDMIEVRETSQVKLPQLLTQAAPPSTSGPNNPTVRKEDQLLRNSSSGVTTSDADFRVELSSSSALEGTNDLAMERLGHGLPPRKRAKYKMSIDYSEEEKKFEGGKNEDARDCSGRRRSHKDYSNVHVDGSEGDDIDTEITNDLDEDYKPLTELKAQLKSKVSLESTNFVNDKRKSSRGRGRGRGRPKKQSKGSVNLESSSVEGVAAREESVTNLASPQVDISEDFRKVGTSHRRKQSNPSPKRVLNDSNKVTKPKKVKPLPPYPNYRPPPTTKPIIYKGVEDLREYKELVQSGKIKDPTKEFEEEEDPSTKENKWADPESDSDVGDMECLQLQFESDEEEDKKGEGTKAEHDALSEVSDTLAQTAKILHESQGNREGGQADRTFEDGFHDITTDFQTIQNKKPRTSEELQHNLLDVAARVAEAEELRRSINNIPVNIFVPCQSSFPVDVNEDTSLIKSYSVPTIVLDNTQDIQAAELEQKGSRYEKKLVDYLKFKDKEFMQKYEKYQNIEGSFFILCEYCAKPMTNMSYKKHVTRMHTSENRERNFMCSICGKQFLNEGNLDKHKLTHTNIRYKCSYCDRTYKQDYNRKSHERTHFQKSKPVKPLTLKKNPTLDKKVECNLCGKVVKATSLKLHMNVHNTDRYKCDICGKHLKLTYKYQHMQMHRESKKHYCHFCGKSSSSKQALKVHIRTHTKERPLKCRFASKHFQGTRLVLTHERRHTGEKPYRCDLCNKNWRDFTTAWCHMRKHHPGVRLTNTQHMKGANRPMVPLEHDHLQPAMTSSTEEPVDDTVQKALQSAVQDMLEENQREARALQSHDPQQQTEPISILPAPKQLQDQQPQHIHQQHHQQSRTNQPVTNQQQLQDDQPPPIHLSTTIKQQLSTNQAHHLQLQHQQIAPLQLQQPLQSALQHLRPAEPAMLQHQQLETFQIPIAIPTEGHHGLANVHHQRQEHQYPDTHHLPFTPYHPGYHHGY